MKKANPILNRNLIYYKMLISKAFKVVERLLSLRFKTIHSIKDVAIFFGYIVHCIRFNGLKTTVKQYKQMRLHVTRYLCGDPLLVNDIGVGIDEDGWPKRLSNFKEIFNSSNDGKRYVLSLMIIGRLFKNKIGDEFVPDLTSITDPYKDQREQGRRKYAYSIPQWFIKDFVKKSGLRKIKLAFSLENVYLSTKASLNGPATLTAQESILHLNPSLVEDLCALTDEEGRTYLNEVLSWSLLNQSEGDEKGVYLNSDFYKCETHRVNTPGKISYIHDPELKVRIIAIFDYFSQLFLKPIHEGLLKNLRRLPQDRTFTQDPWSNWTEDQNSFWSMDLSSATDRFPVKLQKKLMRELIGYDQAKSWENVLVNRAFTVPNEEKPIFYQVGQPMGAYSSWAAFTLTHHLVVHWCAHLCNLVNFKDYIILGDDIVIHNDRVAQVYKRVIGSLGVSLSVAKTHKSKFCYEFAKRWINPILKVEWTGLPIVGIINNINNPLIVFTILFEFFNIKKNYFDYTKNLSFFVRDLFRKLPIIHILWNKSKKTYSSKTYIMNEKKFLKALEIHNLSLRYTFGMSNPEEIRFFLQDNIPNEMYIPAAGDSLREVLAAGVINQVEGFYKQLGIIVKKADDKELISNFPHLPFSIAIGNYGSDAVKALQSFEVGMLTPLELIKEISVLDFDKVWDKQNQNTKILMRAGKAFRDGFKFYNTCYRHFENVVWDHHTGFWKNGFAGIFPFLSNQPDKTLSKVTKRTAQGNNIGWAKWISERDPTAPGADNVVVPTYGPYIDPRNRY